MRQPRPGSPVRGSSSGRPVMALFDLLGRRWAIRLLWEVREGPLGFNELQEHCQSISPSVLSTRLRELSAAHLIVQSDDGGYSLTEDGVALGTLLEPLDHWARNWARTVESDFGK